MPVLVDSSLWVHQLRKSGDAGKRDRVNALLESGEAAWCPAVRLELWRGVTNDTERKRFAVTKPCFPTTRSLLRSGIGRFDSPIIAGHLG